MKPNGPRPWPLPDAHSFRHLYHLLKPTPTLWAVAYWQQAEARVWELKQTDRRPRRHLRDDLGRGKGEVLGRLQAIAGGLLASAQIS